MHTGLQNCKSTCLLSLVKLFLKTPHRGIVSFSSRIGEWDTNHIHELQFFQWFLELYPRFWTVVLSCVNKLNSSCNIMYKMIVVQLKFFFDLLLTTFRHSHTATFKSVIATDSRFSPGNWSWWLRKTAHQPEHGRCDSAKTSSTRRLEENATPLAEP